MSDRRFFFQAGEGIRGWSVTGVQTCALPISVGFWLPETAVDRESLDVIAAAGIAFTVLAPHQVSRAPQHGLPAKIQLDGGRSIAVFAYDGGLSHEVAFGGLQTDPNRWTDALNGTRAGAIAAIAV